MAPKIKTREITFVESGRTFNSFLHKSSAEENYDFESLEILRRLLSNEKARLLHVIKSRNPGSIYTLAKLLGRDFKAVMEDIKLLEKFGFIYLVSEKTGKRTRHKPVLAVSSLNIHFKF